LRPIGTLKNTQSSRIFCGKGAAAAHPLPAGPTLGNGFTPTEAAHTFSVISEKVDQPANDVDRPGAGEI